MIKSGLALFVGMAIAVGTANADCGNSTIAGTYTFTVHGNALTADGTSSTALIDGVGIIEFNGQGGIAQEDFVVRNGTEVSGGPPNPSGFHTGETGTYTLGEDCTGTAHIVLGPGNERFLALVASETGLRIHAVVSSALVGGSSVLLQVYSDFERISQRH